MIDLNRIRSLKRLEEIKTDLKEFLNFDASVMKEVYNENLDEFGGEEEYPDWVEDAAILLEKVERRMASLGKHLSRSPKQTDSCSDATTEQSACSVASQS